MRLTHLLFASTLLAAVPGLVWAASENQPAAAPVAKATDKSSPENNQHAEEGDRIFQQNCSRCHNAPEGFSPRIAGTIVRHMRLRASLSHHDEEELLRFLNP